jgi:hypothetical protein
VSALYDADVDRRVDELLEDAVPPPACEFILRAGDEPCSDPATWLLSISCGHSYYYCTPHHDQIDARLPTPGDGWGEYCDETERAPRHGRLVQVSHVWSEVPR